MVPVLCQIDFVTKYIKAINIAYIDIDNNTGLIGIWKY